MSLRPVVALGATQIVGYGTLYYAFPIALPQVAAEFGVPETWGYAAFAAGMLAGASIAPAVGRAMDRVGAPRVMAAGSALAFMLLALLPFAPNFAVFALLVVALEVVGVAVLYDGAFATLALLRGREARRAITHLTLIAGFASTIYWPLTGWMVEEVGWRITYAAFAGMHLALALPLHLWLASLAKAALRPNAPRDVPAVVEPAVIGAAARQAFTLVATGFALSGMLVAALTVHMVLLVQAAGMGAAAFVISMLMGPSQVAIRLIDAVLWRGLHPVTVATVAAAALPLAVAVLMAAGGTMAGAAGFAVLMGIGGGLSSIVRGTVPLALFGSGGYGAMLGRLTALRTLLSAVAPFGFALVLQAAGSRAAMIAALVAGVASLVPLVLLRRLMARANPSTESPVPQDRAGGAHRQRS